MHSRQRKLEQKADFLNDPLIRDTMPPSQFDALKALTQKPLSPEMKKDSNTAIEEFKRANIWSLPYKIPGARRRH